MEQKSTTRWEKLISRIDEQNSCQYVCQIEAEWEILDWTFVNSYVNGRREKKCSFSLFNKLRYMSFDFIKLVDKSLRLCI